MHPRAKFGELVGWLDGLNMVGWLAGHPQGTKTHVHGGAVGSPLNSLADPFCTPVIHQDMRFGLTLVVGFA